MRELSLHILDIAENSIAADAQAILVDVRVNDHADTLRILIKDDGSGMSAEMAQDVTNPFVTTRTTRSVGLGIPLLKAAAEACNGSFELISTQGEGTRVCAEFQQSHIDRMPLGDIAGTMLTLIVGHPDIHWTFQYKVNDYDYKFDDREVKLILDDVPLTEPSVLQFLREQLDSGITSARSTIPVAAP